MGRFALIFFMDGVGLGSQDGEINPFVHANLSHLTERFGDYWYANHRLILSTEYATLVPTDPTMGVPGRPQSATGQATILTGRNVPAEIDGHYGPKPNQAVRDAIDKEGTLFSDFENSALLTPYPQGYFDAINSGKRLYSSVPYAAVQAGNRLMTASDLVARRAISPGFTGKAWHDQLGYPEVPVYELEEAGAQIAEIAQTHTFSFFEHWPSDHFGHRGTLKEAQTHLELIDGALGGLLKAWETIEDGLLIVTSDHGNIEDKSSRRHTENPVPTIVAGPNHATIAGEIMTLADIAPAVRRFLLD